MALNQNFRPNMNVMAAIEQAIPFDGGITSRTLRAGLALRLGTGTVCRALQYLVAQGRVTFTGEMGKRQYRRLQQHLGEITP